MENAPNRAPTLSLERTLVAANARPVVGPGTYPANPPALRLHVRVSTPSRRCTGSPTSPSITFNFPYFPGSGLFTNKLLF